MKLPAELITPTPIRRIVFATPEEWQTAREDLDRLLALCWTVQNEILDRLPASREREIALQKLEEFACYARLAILGARGEKKPEEAGGDGSQID
ncbi:MAG: hypothetical protein LAQ69_14455 [Acidobacteriia bacterium]|nr:hypothetical protein [Terriglobia bacterium]